MKLALLYPAYLPNLYYLSCLLQADRTIMLDTEPFSRKSRVHRGKIRTPEGFQWLNVPIPTEDRKKPVHQVRIDHGLNWVNKHMMALEYNYRNSIYFDFYEPEIRSDLQQAKEHERLSEFIRFFMERLFIYLQVDVTPEWASRIPGYFSNPDRFASRLGATEVFQEENSRNYQRQSSLRSDPDFIHPHYAQHFGDFVPDLSLLDLLFQLGPSAYEVTGRLQR
ncbi:MAG: WbqC family protein [Balneolales bacterium]